MHICSCCAVMVTSGKVTSLIKLDSKCGEECCITGGDAGAILSPIITYLTVSITTLDYTYIIYNINLLDSRDHLNIIIFLLSRLDADSCWLIYLLPSNIKPATFASYACLLLLARTPNYFSKVRDHS